MGCENCCDNKNQYYNEIATGNGTKDYEDNFLNQVFPTDENAIDESFNNDLKKLPTKGLDIITKEKLIFEFVCEINKYRENHNSPKLEIDEDISDISQKYAEKLARESEIELSGNKFNGEELGEILFSSEEAISPIDLVKLWYFNGSRNYRYDKECRDPNNFTQMVWKSSKYIGVGFTTTKNNTNYLVANFFPCGNIEGQFIKNVLPPKNRSIQSSFYSITTSFLEQALNCHNELRAKHNSPPLILNPVLSTLAQKHAQNMAELDSLVHSDNKYKNQKCGENLFYKENGWEISGEEVTKSWYNEIKKYNFKKRTKNNEKEVENFTQLIWKSTKEVGFGFARTESGAIYAVANYFPCGNIKGSYVFNVLPK